MAEPATTAPSTAAGHKRDTLLATKLHPPPGRATTDGFLVGTTRPGGRYPAATAPCRALARP